MLDKVCSTKDCFCKSSQEKCKCGECLDYFHMDPVMLKSKNVFSEDLVSKVWLSRTIGHVRYISILTWIRGFWVKIVSLFLLSYNSQRRLMNT